MQSGDIYINKVICIISGQCVKAYTIHVGEKSKNRQRDGDN